MFKEKREQSRGNFDIELGPVAPIQKTDVFGTALADNGADPGSPIYNDAPNEKLFGLGSDDSIGTRGLPVWPS